MRNDAGRDIALAHMRQAWEKMQHYIEAGTANREDKTYCYLSDLFERSLDYVERCDLDYKLDKERLEYDID